MEATLMEAAGTYGFYQPTTDTEIVTPRGVQSDHADYVAAHPEEFGLTVEQIPHLEGDDEDARMTWMAQVLDLTLALGWVRLNTFKSAWNMQGRDLKTVRAAIKHYDHIYSGLYEVSVDIGLSSAHPDLGFTLEPYDVIQRFIKTGVIPR